MGVPMLPPVSVDISTVRIVATFCLPGTQVIHGTFPKQADPNVDPKILQSCLLGPKKCTPNFGKSPYRLIDGIPWFLASLHDTRHRDAIRCTREPTTWPTTVLESRPR